MPESILGQLGLKVQHALRAFTAKDRRTIKRTAENYPLTDFYDTETLLTSLGIGIFISSVANTQQEALLLTFLTMFPSIFLAGFFFPIEAMPEWLQVITYIVPLRYMLVVIRGIIVKGVGLQILREQVLAMAIFGVAIMLLAATRFRKRLG